MKKLILFVLVIVSSVNLYAASYKDNQYQKLAEAYAVKAQTAFDEGEYDLAVEYTRQAEENAEIPAQGQRIKLAYNLGVQRGHKRCKDHKNTGH